jgi:hypothetical protein
MYGMALQAGQHHVDVRTSRRGIIVLFLALFRLQVYMLACIQDACAYVFWIRVVAMHDQKLPEKKTDKLHLVVMRTAGHS